MASFQIIRVQTPSRIVGVSLMGINNNASNQPIVSYNGSLSNGSVFANYTNKYIPVDITGRANLFEQIVAELSPLAQTDLNAGRTYSYDCAVMLADNTPDPNRVLTVQAKKYLQPSKPSNFDTDGNGWNDQTIKVDGANFSVPKEYVEFNEWGQEFVGWTFDFKVKNQGYTSNSMISMSNFSTVSLRRQGLNSNVTIYQQLDSLFLSFGYVTKYEGEHSYGNDNEKYFLDRTIICFQHGVTWIKEGLVGTPYYTMYTPNANGPRLTENLAFCTFLDGSSMMTSPRPADMGPISTQTVSDFNQGASGEGGKDMTWGGGTLTDDDNGIVQGDLIDSVTTGHSGGVINKGDGDTFGQGLVGLNQAGGYLMIASNWSLCGQLFDRIFGQEPIDALLDRLNNMFQSPLDVVISAKQFPFTVAEGSTVTVSCGGTALMGGISLPSQFITIDLGVVHIDATYGTFLDYRCSYRIYVPYVGWQTLDPHDVVGRDLHLVYNVDLASGAFAAMLEISGETLDKKFKTQAPLYQWSGEMGLDIPLKSASVDTSKMLSMLGGFLPVGGSPAIPDTVSSTVKTMYGSKGQEVGRVETTETIPGRAAVPAKVSGGNVLESVYGAATSGTQPVSGGGSVSGVSGYLGLSQAVVAITRPLSAYPAGYNKQYGYVSQVSGHVGDSEGYTQLATWTPDVPATDGEIARLDAILRSGYWNTGANQISDPPAGTGFGIGLYTTSDAERSTKKTVSEVATVSGTLKAGSSVVDPVIERVAASADIVRANYAYIPAFGRYYFVTDIAADETSGLWRVSLSCDVLSTYWEQAAACDCIFARVESDGLAQKALSDPLFPISSESWTETKSFPQKFPHYAGGEGRADLVFTLIGCQTASV